VFSNLTYLFYPIHKYQFIHWDLLSVSYVSFFDSNDCVFIVGGFAGIDGMLSEVLSLGLSGSSSRGQNIYQFDKFVKINSNIYHCHLTL